MARKNKNTAAAQTTTNEAPVMEIIQDEQAVETTATEPTEEATAEATEAPAEEATEDQPTAEAAAEAKKKRARNYSQSAIDLPDLDRLNGFKALIKTKMGVSISNQRILNAALNYLGANVEEFLKQLAAEVNDKQKSKDLKKLEDLKKKLGVE